MREGRDSASLFISLSPTLSIFLSKLPRMAPVGRQGLSQPVNTSTECSLGTELAAWSFATGSKNDRALWNCKLRESGQKGAPEKDSEAH